jgi:hypothetical protein
MNAHNGSVKVISKNFTLPAILLSPSPDNFADNDFAKKKSPESSATHGARDFYPLPVTRHSSPITRPSPLVTACIAKKGSKFTKFLTL